MDYDDHQSEFDLKSYDIHINFDGSLQDFEGGFIQNQWKENKEEIPTYHTNKEEKDDKNFNISSYLYSQNQKVSPALQVHKISCSLPTLIKTKKCKEGRTKQTKNILKMLKTQTIIYLNMLTSFQILSKEQQQIIKQLKIQNCSIKNIQKLLQHKKIKQKILEYYLSSQLIKKIMNKPRLTLNRKLEIIKNIGILGQML